MKKLTVLAAVAAMFAFSTATNASENANMGKEEKMEKMMDCKTLAEGSKERADCEAKASEADKKHDAKAEKMEKKSH